MGEGRTAYESLGYFDDPAQTEPAYDPGSAAICPVCQKPLGPIERGLVLCRNLCVGNDRSYFFRYHVSCRDAHGTEAVDQFEVDAVDDMIAREKIQ